MSKLKMNTEKLVEVGEELKKVSKDYNELIDDVFLKLNSIVNDDAWVSENEGKSVHKFMESVTSKKENMQSLAVAIDNLAEEITVYGDGVRVISEDTF